MAIYKWCELCQKVTKRRCFRSIFSVANLEICEECNPLELSGPVDTQVFDRAFNAGVEAARKYVHEHEEIDGCGGEGHGGDFESCDDASCANLRELKR
jgi:hypothetical protein